MVASTQKSTARRLVREHGETLAERAGITLRDKPSPLWRLLVLTLLLSAPISADIATASARELSRSGWRTPHRMLDSTWQERVDALGRGGYRRYDESTATRLASAAELVIERWSGDLRRLHESAGGDPRSTAELLEQVDGIGPTASDIFLREVQAVWSDVCPYSDDLVLRGAAAVGLPATPEALGGLVRPVEFHRLAAACVSCARDDSLAEKIVAASG